MSGIAVLSNINMNGVIRMLGRQTDIFQAEGYGNELGELLNPASACRTYGAEITFLIMDLMELLEHDLEPESAKEKAGQWFRNLEGALETQVIYYISDGYLWGEELAVIFDRGRKQALEEIWQKELERLCREHSNVRIFPLRQMIETLGQENAFSMKMWYMGKIPFSNEAQKRLCSLVLDRVRVEKHTPRKVLLLDLDNTLWGGLAGENDHTPVDLSEDHGGLAYKNLQRVILQMQRQGVILAAVSKNNEQDALEIMDKHPHMVLRPKCFAALRINWKQKHENLEDIAGELNLGTDSFVFWDDNPAERQLIKEMLPEVAVPDFPERPEDLASAMVQIYRKYFEKPSVTKEDLSKTEQYAANAARRQLQQEAGSFEDYLRQLNIVITREDPAGHVERLTQLVNKTNQFNLTTRRFTQAEVTALLEDEARHVYLYHVSDRFGDNGIVAAVIVSCEKFPVVEEFVMSCRVMGKNIEDRIMEDVESDLRCRGYESLYGIYIPTAKNQPVAGLYERLGYDRTEDLPGQEGRVYRKALE